MWGSYAHIHHRGIWRLFRLESTPPLTRFAADMMRREGTINTHKARQDLGYAPVIGVGDGLKNLTEQRG